MRDVRKLVFIGVYMGSLLGHTDVVFSEVIL